MSFRVKLRVRTWKVNTPYFPRFGPLGPMLAAPEIAPPTSCKVCGMSFTDAMGRAVTMGYACPNISCPGKVTCMSTQTQNDPSVMLWNGSYAVGSVQ